MMHENFRFINSLTQYYIQIRRCVARIRHNEKGETFSD